MTVLPEDEAENMARLRRLMDTLEARLQGDVVVLVDGDRTLSASDTSVSFLSLAGLSQQPIKETFQALGYTWSAFRFHAAVYLQLGPTVLEDISATVAATTELYPEAASFLRRASHRANVFVITAGVATIWRMILAREKLERVGLIGGTDVGDPYVLGRWEKGWIAREFIARGKNVIAFGDSDVDSLMLQASHHAVVVVNHRQNKDLLPHIAHHPALCQISHQDFLHSGIRRISYETADQLIITQ